MEQENHIDKALAFIESVQKLGDQLSAAEQHQKAMLSKMLDLKKEGQTDSDEYAELSSKSKGLQDLIDKWHPIYLERMAMLKEVKEQHTIPTKKRTHKK